MVEVEDDRTNSLMKGIRNITAVYTATDGTSTMDNTSANLGTGAFTSDSINVRMFNRFSIYVEETGGANRTLIYQTSPDGTVWFNGAAGIANMNGNSQVVDTTEDSIAYIRFVTGAGTATQVLLKLVAKSV